MDSRRSKSLRRPVTLDRSVVLGCGVTAIQARDAMKSADSRNELDEMDTFPSS